MDTESRRRATPVPPPVRVGAPSPRAPHPPHPERLWASNGWDRYRTPRRRDHATLYLVVALLVFWGFALLGTAMLLTELAAIIGLL